MKLVALLTFKNEAWILPAYLSSVAPVVDEIVAIDDGSTDDSRRLLEDAGGYVVDSTLGDLQRDGGFRAEIFPSEHALRDLLLRLGRERGGTHFLSLDADEALTPPCQHHIRDSLAELEPGQKLAMQWLTLWKRPDKYRRDESVWTDLFKDFAWADRAGTTLIGAARTPGDNAVENWTRLAPERGAVLHYQFVPWRRTQAKQAWYRCFALIRTPDRAYEINRMYALSLDSSAARTVEVPSAWLEGITIPDRLADLPPAWHLNAINDWFDEYGIEYFEPLQIWHVPELRDRFIDVVGREPCPIVRLAPMRRVTRALHTRIDAARRRLV
jgi:hypothetical protein